MNNIGDRDARAIIAAVIYVGHRYARELGINTKQSEVVRQDKLLDPDLFPRFQYLIFAELFLREFCVIELSMVMHRPECAR